MKGIIQFVLVLAFAFFYPRREALAQWRSYGQGMGPGMTGLGIWHGVVWNDPYGSFLGSRHRWNHFFDQVALCFKRD